MSVDTNLHVDPTRVSVDTILRMNATPDVSLTRGYHSNNLSVTLHDVESDCIAWFTHHTKCGTWEGFQLGGTLSNGEGDMLYELLGKVKSNGYNLDQLDQIVQ